MQKCWFRWGHKAVPVHEPPAFRCPGCKKTVTRTDECFPFCSERCRVTDLGQWAAGDYRIAGEAASVPENSDSEF